MSIVMAVEICDKPFAGLALECTQIAINSRSGKLLLVLKFV